MAKYRARWLGTEARLMFDVLHCTHLRLGDASRFGPEHLQRALKTVMVKVATAFWEPARSLPASW
jgi:hypothetical protein